jgi:hypothetical protein
VSQACPRCARPVALARAQCLYCGAVLSEEQLQAASAAVESLAAESAPPPAPERHIVVLDLRETAPEALVAALGVSAFEAEQRRRRGGYQLHRIAPPDSARDEAERLQRAGLRASVVPEAEARAAAAPELALGGRWDGQALALRTVEGSREVGGGALLLVVRGPIARALEEPQRHFKRVRLAGPGEGRRIHLHLRAEERPLEIDPDDFEMGLAPGEGPAVVTLLGWVRALAEGVPLDEGFRFLTPALGPAQPPLPGAARALDPTRSGNSSRPALFDNVAQFRFYSGWRAAVERLGTQTL